MHSELPYENGATILLTINLWPKLLESVVCVDLHLRLPAHVRGGCPGDRVGCPGGLVYNSENLRYKKEGVIII